MSSGISIHDSASRCTWPWSDVTSSAAVVGQRVDQLADEAIDEAELARERTVVQAELVRDRVDPG